MQGKGGECMMDSFDIRNISKNDFLQNIIDTTQTMMFWKDEQRRFLGVNQAFLDYYGFKSQDELIGKTDEDMGWHSTPDPFQDDEWRVLHEGIRTHMVHGKCMAKGEERDIMASKSPLYADGKIVGMVGSFIDVTEQFRQRNQIEELTRKLDGIPGGIAIYKRFYGQLQCISANQCLAQLLGTTQEALTGKFLSGLMKEYMEEESRQRFLWECPVLEGHHRHAAGTYQFQNKSTGVPVWLHMTCRLVREPNDEELVYCTYTNVDRLIHYQDEIHRRNRIASERYTRAMTMLNEGQERDLIAKGHYNFTRNEVLDYKTYSNDVYSFNLPMTYDAAFAGMMQLSFLKSDLQALEGALLRRNILNNFERGQDHINVRYRRILNGQEPLWVNLVLQLFVMPDTGDVEGISYAYNITETMLKESIIQRLGSLGYDELGLVYTGSRFWRCYQYQERQEWLHKLTHTCGDWDEEMARYVRENVLPDQRERVLRETSISVIMAYLAQADVYSCTHTIKLPNGVIRQKELKFSYLNNVRETVFYCLSDITAQFVRENEQIAELTEAKQVAEAASSAKASFFASISHDMRTPLNGVIGYTDLAIGTDDMGTVKDYLSKIRISGGLLLSLINDVLDFGKYVNHKVRLQTEPIQIGTLCRDVDTVIRPLADHKRIAFHMKRTAVFEGLVEADPLRVQQLLVNLLSNAVKFTKSGGLVENIITEADRGEYVDCTILVRDNGIGMSKEFLPKIFDAYSQEERRSASKTVGTGLGMAIVKEIVDLMGGTIAVESEIDVGTVYTVHLSLKKYDGPAIEPDRAVAHVSADILKGKRVLLCENNELNAEIAQLLLQQWGMIVTWAENGREAVEIWRSPEPYDLVLMDKRMPVMDGLDATKAIRQSEEGKGSHIPIIAMTGDVDEASIQTCLEAGMDDHVGKPIDRDTLSRVMRSVLQKQRSCQ